MGELVYVVLIENENYSRFNTAVLFNSLKRATHYVRAEGFLQNFGHYYVKDDMDGITRATIVICDLRGD